MAFRCGDVTADGDTDALFTVASGGTAGLTFRSGVLRGPEWYGPPWARSRSTGRATRSASRVATRALFDVTPAALREKNDANLSLGP